VKRLDLDELAAAIVAAMERPLHPTRSLDLDAVDRIVAAVDLSADIARQQLLNDLEGEFQIFRTGLIMRDAPKDRTDAIAAIVKALEDGQKLLDHYIEKYGRLNLWRHRKALDRVLEDVRKESGPELNRIVGFKQSAKLSTNERLVYGLREIFERHWKAEAGYTDDKYTELTTGHVVDFIDAVLREVGVHYDRPSITRTMRKPR
jgi:hypothetical protein